MSKMKTISTIVVLNFLLFGLNHIYAQSGVGKDANLGMQAKTVGEQVVVEWSIAFEPNEAIFMIERSTDGKSFTALGSPEVTEDNPLSLTSTFTDPQPASGINYYRVKQTNFDGSSDFSGIVAVQVVAQALDIIQGSSNSTLEVNVADFVEQNVSIEIMDFAGQSITTCQYDLSAQMKEWVHVDMSAHPKGLYYVVLKTAAIKHKAKVIIA